MEYACYHTQHLYISLVSTSMIPAADSLKFQLSFYRSHYQLPFRQWLGAIHYQDVAAADTGLCVRVPSHSHKKGSGRTTNQKSIQVQSFFTELFRGRSKTGIAHFRQLLSKCSE